MKPSLPLLFTAGLLACASNASMPPAAPADGLNRFAGNVYAKLAEKETGNLFFSPYSLHAALTMTAAGAKGETERQLAALLDEGVPADARNANAKRLADTLRAAQKDGSVTLTVANRTWVQRDFKVLGTYQETLRTQFDSALVPADIRANTDGVRREINGWVEKQTREKIVDLIPDGALTPDMKMVLANAIYFYGTWRKPFEKEQTKDAPFHLADGSTANVPLMNTFLETAYGEAAGVQAVEIPYKGLRLSMVVLLPPAGGLAALEQGLQREGLAKFLPQRGREVVLSLPRFKSSGAFELAKPLAALGAGLAFSDAADFSGMTGARDLMIGAVLHKAVIDVNEKGTEAAAATAVLMMPTSVAIQQEEPVIFRADRPFVYAIIERETRAILFLGRLMDPRP